MQCKHFGICGGCMLQNLSYDEQLHLKKDFVARQAYKAKIDLPEFKIIPSPKVFFYRNKVELSFSPSDSYSCLGFHKKASRSVIDLEECLLFSENLPELLVVIKDFVRSSGLPAYDKYKHTGFWRYCVIRKNRCGEHILGLVVSSQNKVDWDGFVSACKSLSYVRGVFEVVYDGLGDAVGYEQIRSLAGDEYIIEQLCDVEFIIGLKGFFQINYWATEYLYRRILHYVSDIQVNKILDLYAGSGGIGLILAKHGFDVLGIEIDEASIVMAKKNVVLNNIQTYTMLKGNVRALLGINSSWRDSFDCVIIDPPRSGLPPKVRHRILKLRAKFIIYISCNPVTLMKDLVDLLLCYEIVDFFVLDMFPHTVHVETVVMLKRR